VASLLDAAAETLVAARTIWIGTHRDPDGDAIGSLLGLGWLLEGLGKEVILACQDPVPEDLLFLPGAERITGSPPPERCDTLVAVDAGDAARLGAIHDAALWARRPTVVLDHHASNSGFGHVDVVDASAASTAELILELAGRLDLQIDPRTAECLLAGLLTDTLGFRTSNVTAETLRRAARLADAGGPLPVLAQTIFATRPLPTVRLLGRAIEHLQVRGACGVAWLDQGDFAWAGARAEHTKGIANFLVEARPLAAVALLRETEDGGVDLSLRSRPGTPVVQVATRFGGGGHPQAAGARIEGPLAEAVDRVWQVLGAELDSQTTPP
jgi:phosphoesterase RecJ-like protein